MNLYLHELEPEIALGDTIYERPTARRFDVVLANPRRFHISEVKERDDKLDITWLKDESLAGAEDLPEPQDLAAEAITELEAVVNDLREMLTLLEREEAATAAD